MIPASVLIVEDERLASAALQKMLAAHPPLRVLGVARDGKTAVDEIRRLKPDIVFLDVELPELDGFQVMEQIGAEHMPITIFVTAFDRYTLRAFDVHALDYLLKPFEEGRFITALHRALQQLRISHELRRADLASLLDSLRSNRLPVKTSGRTIFVELDDVDYLEAAGNYVRIHTGDREYIMRETMNSFEGRLRAHAFIRVHRSVIVNRHRIQELRPWYTGQYVVVLRSGKELTLSRGYRDRLSLLTAND